MCTELYQDPTLPSGSLVPRLTPRKECSLFPDRRSFKGLVTIEFLLGRRVQPYLLY